MFIVWKLDRFARNTTDHYGIQAQLAKSGTRLQSVTEPIINEGPLGKMAEAMLAGYAQFENDIRKQRCEAGMQRRIFEGIWPWMPPLGYVHAKRLTDRRKTRPDEPDRERFTVIQQGLKNFARGQHTITSLTNALNRSGLQTRTGRRIFKQQVERMLKDKFYAGILLNPWTGEEHRALHQAMISLEEYYEIQAIKTAASHRRGAPRQSKHPDFPLRQFVSCVCGHGLTASWQRGHLDRYAYYHCYNSDCHFFRRYVPAKRLETAFTQLLASVTPAPESIRAFEQLIIKAWDARHQLRLVTSKKARDQLRSLEERKRRLVEMRLAGEIDREEFTKIKADLEGRLAEARAIKTQPDKEFDLPGALRAARRFISSPASMWGEVLDVAVKQRLQRLVLPQGVVFDIGTASFRTLELSRLFKLFEGSSDPQSHVVAGVGRYLNQIVQDVKNIVDYQKLTEAA